MGTNIKISQQISGLNPSATSVTVIDQKLDELIKLLEQTEIDSERMETYKRRFNAAVDNNPLEAFKQLDNEELSREELLNNLGRLLAENPIDSKMTSEIVKKSTTKRIVLGLIGALMVTLGFAMIIMPAPPYFEMFTIYYFSNDDGITLMDLISLLIVLCGIYLLVMSLIKHKKGM